MCNCFTFGQVNCFETPPTPKSEVSSHESYKLARPHPCKCRPKYNYNRYKKNHFGIYLPRDGDYSENNVTVTPAKSTESNPITENPGDDADTKSTASRQSAVSKKTVETLSDNRTEG